MSKNKTTAQSQRTRTHNPSKRTPETEAQLQRIASVETKAKRAATIAAAAVQACNHRIDENAGMFIPTPQMQAAVARANAAAMALNQVYLDTVVTPDLPDNVLIHVLRVRIIYMATDERVWCAKIRSLGGPRITPRWLSKYMLNHLLGRGDRIDPRVRRALILEGAKTPRPAVGR